ncbi:MAG: histidine kinase dimerization/phospho-acceptor domain-containing protein [bacterium]
MDNQRKTYIKQKSLLSAFDFYFVLSLFILYVFQSMNVAQAFSVQPRFQKPIHGLGGGSQSILGLALYDGFLWAGTNARGVCKYTGSGQKCYLKGKLSFHALLSHETGLYAGSNSGGLFRWNKSNNTFDELLGEEYRIWSIFPFRKKIWLALDEGGLLEYNPKTNELKPFRLSINGQSTSSDQLPKVFSFYEDGDHVLIGTQQGLLFSRVSQDMYFYQRKIQLTDQGKLHGVRAIERIKPGRYWLGTNEGLFEWNGQVNELTIVNSKIRFIRQLLLDRTGDVWISSVELNGMKRYHNGKLITHLPDRLHPEGLPGNQVWQVLQTSKGLWFGFVDGLVFLPSDLSKIQIIRELGNDASATEVSVYVDGVLLRKTSHNRENYYWMEQDKFTELHDGAMVSGISKSSSFRPLWISDNKLHYMKGSQVASVNVSLEDVREIDVFTMSQTGLWHIALDFIEYSSLKESGLSGKRFRWNYNGNLGAIAMENSITQRNDDGNTLLFVDTRPFVSFVSTKCDEISYRAIAGEQSPIASISRFDQHSFFVRSGQKTYHAQIPDDCNSTSLEAQPMPFLDGVLWRSIALDQSGRIWALVDGELLMWNKDSSVYQVIGQQYLLPDLSSHAQLSVTHEGMIVVSGYGPVVLFDPSILDVEINVRPPSIDKFTWNHQEVNSANPELKLEAGTIDFELKAGEIVPYKMLSFQYRLHQTDPWREMGQPKLSLQELAAGDYVVQFRESYLERWSISSSPIQFEILAPWYFRPLAIVIYALLILLIFVLYGRYYMRRLEKAKAINQELKEAAELRENFVGKLKLRVDDATRELAGTVDHLQMKTIELDSSRKHAMQLVDMRTEFFAAMSHDIRTPLTGIQGFLSLLKDTSLDKTQLQFVKTASESSENLQQIINDILDISKLEAGKMTLFHEQVNLREMLLTLIQSLAPVSVKKKLDLLLIIDPEIPEVVDLDVTRLKQILTNLLGNSIKFTNKGYIQLEVLLLSREAEQCQIKFSVKDSGIGIDPNAQGEIFEAFKQTNFQAVRKSGGSGLGLMISNRLVELGGGELKLSSAPDKGSEFSFVWNLKIITNSVLPEIYTDSISLVGSDEQHVDQLYWMARHAGFVHCEKNLITDEVWSNANQVIISYNHENWHTRNWQVQKIPKDSKAIILAPVLDPQRINEVSELLGLPVMSIQTPASTWYYLINSTTVYQVSSIPMSQRLSGLSILVAEDKAVVRNYLRHFLEGEGATVFEVMGAEDVIPSLGDFEIDVVLLDLDLGSASGADIAHDIRTSRQSFAGVRIICVTANIMYKEKALEKDSYFDAFVPKPIDENILITEILNKTSDEN